MEDTTAALKAAEELVEALRKTPSASNPADHLRLTKLADKARRALDTPYDMISRHAINLALAATLETLIKTGAVDKVPFPPGTPISAAELASAINMDISALQRLMRFAISSGIFTEPEPDVYAHNSISPIYKMDAMGPFFLMCVDHSGMSSPLPGYFKTHSPSDVFNPRKSPYAYSKGKEGLTYYETLDLDPEFRQIWNAVLQMMEKGMPISGMFPFESMKEAVEKEPERPFVVDVAGGRGQALLKLQEEIPGVFGGRLVLQDLPIVIDTLGDEEYREKGIETMSYDIFREQPVKNAHIYFMRRLLHDFYGPECITILKNTASAMGPDSRLIVSDMLVPDKVDVENGPKELYWLDYGMMLIGGKEKTLKEFEEIFDAAGLELVKIWPSALGATVQLETRLKR
ncbi:Sterigmatocystin 8-O-methyltransferase [Naviculisporaceae sp. PSN 640]